MKPTEAEKQAYVRQKTFYCKRLQCRLSIAACEKIQKRSIETTGWNPVDICQTCPGFSRPRKNLPRKVCKLAKQYPGTCVGEGCFYRRETQTDHAWNRKEYCTQQCAVRWNHFKASGWNTSNDVRQTYFQ